MEEFGISFVSREDLRQPNITWLLVTLLGRSTMKKSKWEQKEIQNVQVEEKRIPGNFVLEPWFVLQGMRR